MNKTTTQIPTESATSPVQLNREAQQPPDIPSSPTVKPNDEAMRILSLFKPKRNKVTGTDKSKPPTIKGNKLPDGVKPVPDVPLEKIGLNTLGAVGLGLYVSDLFTRDAKQKQQRELESEWQRALDSQQRYSNTRKKNERFKKSLRHGGNEIKTYDSAWDKLVDYYTGVKV